MKTKSSQAPRTLMLFTILILLTATLFVVNAQPEASAIQKSGMIAADEDVGFVGVEATEINLTRGIGNVSEPKGATGIEIYLIRLNDAPIASYRGGITNLVATNPAARGETKLDPRNVDSLAYEAYLEGQQADFLAEAGSLLGRTLDAQFTYQHAFNGVAIEMTPVEASAIAALPGVAHVQRDQLRYPLTDYGPQWIGADGIWDGSTTGGLPGTLGEGIIIGVIDTGLNMDHPSFADIGGDGYDHTNPFGAGNYVGLCDSDPGSWTCNDKLIGYWIFTSETTEDTDGHGSHTASTSAGNVLLAGTVDLSPYSYSPAISGVAPHANIIGYDGCDDGGGCPLSALTASIDQTVIDGVDVINYSIGGGTSDPWTDADALAFLAAADAGIVPVTSAGNSGPGPSTVGSPGDAPWMLTVGASTHNRAGLNGISNMTGGNTTPPGDIAGRGFFGGHGPAPIVYAGDFGDALCLNSFAPGTWTNNEIVVCDRGTIARVAKGYNVLQGGAGGYVLANSSDGQSLNGDVHHLPAVQISFADGTTLKTWLASGTGHMATIDGTTLSTDPANGDMMAGFSSRGPLVNTASDIIKPDVTAPGVDVLAAYRSTAPDADNPTSEYAVISGTSMSSPHTAGAAALLKALHPTWSVAEIKSALMSTALTAGVVKEDGTTPADPFDMGGGRIDLTMAGVTGLVLDETTTNFIDADPASGGDPKTLNLASMGNSQCLESCSWTRTVSSTQSVSVTWTASISIPAGMVLTVDPAMFMLPAGGTQMITVTADVSGLPVGQWAFAEVALSNDNGNADAHFPVAVVPVSGLVPTSVDIDTRRNAGSHLVAGLETIEITDLTITNYGLTEGTVSTDALGQDPTRDDPYDNLNDGTTIFVTVTVPAGAERLVAEVPESTAPDIDLYVGTGDTPSVGTQVCASTSSSFVEYCDITDPAAGTWWVLVQNWEESGSPPDDTTWIYAVVTGDEGNMSVTGPSAVPAGTPYDLRIFWDIPSMVAGDYWYGVVGIGTDPSNPENIAVVPVDLTRHDDDVSKEASVSEASPGMTVSYTITVQPNVTSEDLTYMITDTVPAGLTLNPASIQASDGTVSSVGNTVYWEGNMISPSNAGRDYVVVTSLTDPACTMPLANSGSYVDLEAFGFLTNPGINGPGPWQDASYGGNPYAYYDNPTGIALYFTDEGYVTLDINSVFGGPYTNSAIPSAGLPDAVMAVLWNQMEIVYEAGSGESNRGVTTGIQLTSGGIPSAKLLEFDDIQLPGDPSSQIDFEVVIYEAINDDAGAYEIRFAYDNITGGFTNMTVGSIGVENHDGSVGTQYAYNDANLQTLQDGMAVCFDWAEVTSESVVITYEATVDVGAAGVLTNNAEHDTDNPGSVPVVASTDVIVPVYGVEIAPDAAITDTVGTTVTYTLHVTNTGNVTDTFDLSASGIWTPTLSASSVNLGAGSSTMVEVAVDIPADATDSEMETATVTATSQGDGGVSDSAMLTTTAVVDEVHIYLPFIAKN